ncbi:MAG: DNA-directed RNA polymerase subunit delta [Bacilli bacterium]|nr:DNA-directed RNA polymerase subunit delta [Bacilli bacterium]
MSINNMSKDELELLSYKDITNILLEENGAMSTKDLFKTITNLLELPSKVFETKIGDYYTTLTTDKRFILLEDGSWDLRVKHTSDKVVVAVDDDDSEDVEELDNQDDSLDEDENNFDEENNDDDFDDSDDDLKDLVIMDEDELELEQ